MAEYSTSSENGVATTWLHTALPLAQRSHTHTHTKNTQNKANKGSRATRLTVFFTRCSKSRRCHHFVAEETQLKTEFELGGHCISNTDTLQCHVWTATEGGASPLSLGWLRLQRKGDL